MSQETDIWNHLYTYGSITPIDALKEYGCFRLGARIFDLRSEGYDIQTIIVEVKGKKFAKYVFNNNREESNGDHLQTVSSSDH